MIGNRPKEDDNTNPRATSTLSSDSRGASYVLGYLIVFSVVVMSGFGIFVLGAGSLTDSVQSQEVQAGQENMQHLRSDLNDIAANGVPYRQVSMQPANAQITYGHRVTINITGQSLDSNINITGDANFTSRAMIYRIPEENTRFVYVGGLIMRVDDSRTKALLRKTPNFQRSLTRSVFVIPGVEKQPSSSHSIGVSGGGSKVSITASRNDYQLIKRSEPDAGDTINGSVIIGNYKHQEPWLKYFRETQYSNVRRTDIDNDGNTEIVADYQSRRVYVQAALIRTTLGKEA